MLKKTLLLMILTVQVFIAGAGALSKVVIPLQKGECWWGGFVAQGGQMPYLKPMAELNLETQNFNNQGVPFLLSNHGRYVWSDAPFRFQFSDKELIIRSQYDTAIRVTEAGKTLRDAYLAASARHFPPSGVLPDSLLFSMPQYNTWIELMYNQNQHDVELYAENILRNGFPAGVLMIDDNWQKYYGNYDFKPETFPDPAGMVKRLHDKGFKVMLWIAPYVSPDCPEFRELEAKGMLVKRRDNGGTALIRWWNGYSAMYDLTNPATFEYLVQTLKNTQKKYGIDGFKFDGGDVVYSGTGLMGHDKNALATDFTMKWAELGLHFPFNEYRACWRMGGQALVQRLGDKDYSWNAVRQLVPDMISAGLAGYAYTCPDMIGGGSFSAFLNIRDDQFDQALIVRSAQSHALMPMMQFSVAPWRILNQENLAICRQMAQLHSRMGSYILECARKSAKTGEPIVRHMEYMFPGQGFETCKDQYMLGEKFLIAPVIDSRLERKVKLPAGRWKDDQGKVWKGGNEIAVKAPLERLPYFERLK